MYRKETAKDSPWCPKRSPWVAKNGKSNNEPTARRGSRSFHMSVLDRAAQGWKGGGSTTPHETAGFCPSISSTAAAAAPGSETALSGPGEGSGGQPQPPLLSESQSLPRKSLVDFNSCRDSEAVRGSPYWGLQLMERSAPPWVV